MGQLSILAIRVMKNWYQIFHLSPFIISNSLTESIDTETQPEGRVFFQLPKNRRPSILHQNSQPTLRERVKGSPRFPHRIAPTSSLSALQEGAYKVSTIGQFSDFVVLSLIILQ